jgi:hypothetical protein
MEPLTVFASKPSRFALRSSMGNAHVRTQSLPRCSIRMPNDLPEPEHFAMITFAFNGPAIVYTPCYKIAV